MFTTCALVPKTNAKTKIILHQKNFKLNELKYPNMLNYEKLSIGKTHSRYQKNDYLLKGGKVDFLDYRLQFTEACQFIKLN